MSLAIVAKVDPKGVTVVDSQTLLVRIPCGLITLNFSSPDEMMTAAEAMAFTATMATPPVVLVPETPKNANGEEVVAIEETPPPPTPRDHSNDINSCDDGSRDLLASSDEEEEDHGDDAGEDEDDEFDDTLLADGVRRIAINAKNQDDSFEDAIGVPLVGTPQCP